MIWLRLRLRNEHSLTSFINYKVIIISKALVVLGPVIHSPLEKGNTSYCWVFGGKFLKKVVCWGIREKREQAIPEAHEQCQSGTSHLEENIKRQLQL